MYKQGRRVRQEKKGQSAYCMNERAGEKNKCRENEIQNRMRGDMR